MINRKITAVLKQGKYFFPEMEKDPTNYIHKTPLGKGYHHRKKEFLKNLLKPWTINWQEPFYFVESSIWCRDNKTSLKKAQALLIQDLTKTMKKKFGYTDDNVVNIGNQFKVLIKQK